MSGRDGEEVSTDTQVLPPTDYRDRHSCSPTRREQTGVGTGTRVFLRDRSRREQGVGSGSPTRVVTTCHLPLDLFPLPLFPRTRPSGPSTPSYPVFRYPKHPPPGDQCRGRWQHWSGDRSVIRGTRGSGVTAGDVPNVVYVRLL